MTSPFPLGSRVIFPAKKGIDMFTDYDVTPPHTFCRGFQYGIIVKSELEEAGDMVRYTIVEAMTGNFLTRTWGNEFRLATEEDDFPPPSCPNVAAVCKPYGVELK